MGTSHILLHQRLRRRCRWCMMSLHLLTTWGQERMMDTIRQRAGVQMDGSILMTPPSQPCHQTQSLSAGRATYFSWNVVVLHRSPARSHNSELVTHLLGRMWWTSIGLSLQGLMADSYDAFRLRVFS